LARIREKNPFNKIKMAFQFSNRTFKAFRQKFSSQKNISPANIKTINAHLKRYDNIKIEMDRLDGIMRSRIIKIIVNEQQNDLLTHWFTSNVLIYNELIDLFEIVYAKYKAKHLLTHSNSPRLGRLIAQSLMKDKEFPAGGAKLRDMYNDYFIQKYHLPNVVTADIIRTFASNVKGNVTKMNAGKINDFKMNRRVMEKNYSISIQHANTKKSGFYPTLFGKIKIDAREKYLNGDEKEIFSWSQVVHDYKLRYDASRKSYCINVPLYKIPKTIPNRKPIAIMDPGAVIFQELYGLDHTVTIGPGLHKPLMKRFNRIAYLDKRIKNKEFNEQEKAKHIERQQTKEVNPKCIKRRKRKIRRMRKMREEEKREMRKRKQGI